MDGFGDERDRRGGRSGHGEDIARRRGGRMAAQTMAAKTAFDALIKRREDNRKRTQKLMGNAERYTQQMEDDGYSLR